MCRATTAEFSLAQRANRVLIESLTPTTYACGYADLLYKQDAGLFPRRVGQALGQAIVGNVNAPAEGVGARKKPEVQPHALAYAPGVPVLGQIEAERATVPRAGGAGV
jgi:hypothetical protein